MSLSKLPWNHFDPHHHFPDKQKFGSYYRDSFVPPNLLPSIGLSLSAAFPHPQPQPQPHPNMTNPSNMNALSADEMERFQKLSNTYEPEVQVRDT